jgi:uncharacterized protein DUF4232
MEPNRKTDRILSEWHAVSAGARRPSRAPRPGRTSGAWSSLGLAGAGLLAAGLVIAVAAFGGRSTTGVGGTEPSASPASSSIAVAPTPSHIASAAAATGSPSPTTEPTPRPTATRTPDCAAADLSAQIKSWEGAAGSRIATVELKVTGSGTCTIESLMRQRLVDGAGQTLADSGAVHGGSTLTVHSGDVLSTLVDVSNVCATSVAPPVSITFVVGNQWLRAKPLSPTDSTVPPCNGPSQPPSMQMHDWAKA